MTTAETVMTTTMSLDTASALLELHDMTHCRECDCVLETAGPKCSGCASTDAYVAYFVDLHEDRVSSGYFSDERPVVSLLFSEAF